MVKRVRAIGIIFVSIIGHNGLETKKCLNGGIGAIDDDDHILAVRGRL